MSSRRRWAAAAALALALSAPASARADWISPGPLAAAHADLDREGRCERCHEAGGGVLEARCLSCHTEVAGPLRQGRGYHAKLIRQSGKACKGCHSDHRGRSYPLIRWSPPAGFDHGAETGFDLDGAHAGAACGACHERRPAYMGAKTTCGGCHEDPHKAELGGDCERCHTTAAFQPASRFDHDRHTEFPLEAKHAAVTCDRCHPRGGARTPSRHPTYRIDRFGDCSGCHADPHRGRTALSSCRSCHATTGWEDTRGLPPAHGPAGWPLVGRHQPVECRDCHGSDLAASVPSECVSCHQDVHGGRLGRRCQQCHDESGWTLSRSMARRFDHDSTDYPLRGRHRTTACRDCHPARGGYAATWQRVAHATCDDCHRAWHPETFVTVEPSTRCESCHTVEGFAVSTFGAAEHRAARFPLEGSHLAAPCGECHAREPRSPTHLAGFDSLACAACHADPHGGQFEAEMAADSSCDACHSTVGWARDAIDHDATPFPLRGAHADAACASCHRATPDAAGEEVIEYRGLPVVCGGCHADAHLGQFQVAGPARGCEDCHAPQAWQIEDFDHAKLTRWVLDGAHAEVACDRCHLPAPVPDREPVIRWRLGEQACADCHQNPHARPRR